MRGSGINRSLNRSKKKYTYRNILKLKMSEKVTEIKFSNVVAVKKYKPNKSDFVKS